VFHSWLLVVRGEVRRTGRRGVSLRATGCWELSALHEAWRLGGMSDVHTAMAAADERGRVEHGPGPAGSGEGEQARRVLVHSTGFRLSPYADVKPAGQATQAAPRKLWHSSPGSAGG
jgi:error-prone DNA polymerase